MSDTPKFNLDKLEEFERKSSEEESLEKEFSVLCVDDEIINTKTLSNLLSEEYKVYTALSAKEAMTILRETKVDVVITDQRMPETVGVDFLKDLVSNNLTDNIRIILTGYTDINDLIECINNGLIDRYLMKPWDADELLEVVRQSIEKIKTKRAIEKLIEINMGDDDLPLNLAELKITLPKKKN